MVALSTSNAPDDGSPDDGTVREVRVRIDFHGPFRIGTGTPQDGAHDVVDQDDPLPASSLKGLMRASARHLLPGAEGLLDAVFGTGRQPSPWHWDSAAFLVPPLVTRRTRIAVDGGRGIAKRNALFVTEEQWSRGATFEVTRMAPLPPEQVADHRTVLACAAAGIHSLGGSRRRGLGWVTCVPTSPVVDDHLLTHFEELRSRHCA